MLRKLIHSIFLLLILIPSVNCQQSISNHCPIIIDEENYFSYRYGYRMFVYDNTVWLYNGLINPWKSYNDGKKYVSEIWCSQDGIHFEIAVEDSIIDDDTGYAISEFMNGLIAIGRKHSSNDVLYSENGYDWFSTNKEYPFQPRNRSELLSFQNKLWLLGGTGKTDAWSTDDGVNWKLESSPLNEAYSDYKAIVFNDQMIVIGSEEGLYVTSDGIQWDEIKVDAQDNKNLIGNYPESYRKRFDIVEYKDNLYILGGGGWNSPGHNAYFDPLEEFESSYNDVWRSSNGTDWEQIANIRDDLPDQKEVAIRYYVENDTNPDNMEYWELIDKYSKYEFSEDEILTAYEAQYRAIYDTYSPSLEVHAVVFNDKIYLYNYDEIWTTEDGVNWTLLAFLENSRSNYEGYSGSPKTQALKLEALKAKYGDRWEQVRLEGKP